MTTSVEPAMTAEEIGKEELTAHLKRLGFASIVSLFGGIFVTIDSPFNQGFSTLTTGWAIINLIICIASALGRNKPMLIQKTREFLWLNMGLNCGYIGVGAAMAILGDPWTHGAGWAVIVQGAILFVLDGYLIRRFPKLSS
jgi:hypothetical protein